MIRLTASHRQTLVKIFYDFLNDIDLSSSYPLYINDLKCRLDDTIGTYILLY